jgi:hypothetical protein
MPPNDQPSLNFSNLGRRQRYLRRLRRAHAGCRRAATEAQNHELRKSRRVNAALVDKTDPAALMEVVQSYSR